MDAYEIHEARFLQVYIVASAAGAVQLAMSPVVPRGKIWTVFAASVWPSVVETRQVSFAIYNGATAFGINIPQSLPLSPSIVLGMLAAGMEIKLFPGESLYAYRDSATAGSTMHSNLRFIETVLPYYSYEEPLKNVVKQAQRHGSVYRSSGAISTGGGLPPGGHGGGEGGGGGPEPY